MRGKGERWRSPPGNGREMVCYMGRGVRGNRGGIGPSGFYLRLILSKNGKYGMQAGIMCGCLFKKKKSEGKLMT